MILDNINEVYYGGNIYTDRMASIISEMQKTKSDSDSAMILCTELLDTLKDFTGIKFCLSLDKAGLVYTIPINHPLTISASKDKIKVKNLKKDDTILIGINPGLLFISPFTKDKRNGLNSREVTSTILHELGHTITKSVVPLMDYTNALKQSLQIKSSIIFAVSKGNKPSSSIIEEYVNTIVSIANQVIDTGKELAGYTIKSVVASLIPSKFYNAYLDEKFADSFATIYGFGPELSSAMLKIKKLNLDSHPKALTDLFDGCVNLSINGLMDEHPHDLARMNTQIELLEKELNSTICDRATKKEILSQIKDIKININAYSNMIKNNPYTFSEYAYKEILTSLIPSNRNGDIFSILTKDSFISDTLDKRLK